MNYLEHGDGVGMVDGGRMVEGLPSCSMCLIKFVEEENLGLSLGLSFSLRSYLLVTCKS